MTFPNARGHGGPQPVDRGRRRHGQGWFALSAPPDQSRMLGAMSTTRSAAILVALLLITGCASTQWHWTDPGAQVVEGAWVTDDVACPKDSIEPCGVAVRSAIAWLSQQARNEEVVDSRVAQVPVDWVDGAGHPHMSASGSLFGTSIAILSLASGKVRLVALLCRSETHDNCGHVDPAVCSAEGDVWGQYLVGAPPPPVLGG